MIVDEEESWEMRDNCTYLKVVEEDVVEEDNVEEVVVDIRPVE